MLGCRSSDEGEQPLSTGSDGSSAASFRPGVHLRAPAASPSVLEVGLALAELLAHDDAALAVGDAAADGAACGDVGVLTGDEDDGAASLCVGWLCARAGAGGVAAAEFFFFLRRLRLFLRLAEVVAVEAAVAAAACCGCSR